MLALAVVLPLISLPFEYAGEVLSRRNGLSRQTTGGWLADQAKARAIGLVLGGLIALGLLGLGRLWPNWWPVPAWGGAMVVSVALSVLFPVLLLPLFMKSEPLSDGPMADALWETVRTSGVPVKEMRLLHMGEKTSAANAMVAGLGPTLRVYVGDTIAEGEDAEEGLTDTRLVLAHELGHHAHGDVWRLLGITALTLAAGMAGAWLAVRELSPDGPGHLTSLPSLVLGLTLGSALVSPLGAAYSRALERRADAYAVDVTGQGERYARHVRAAGRPEPDGAGAAPAVARADGLASHAGRADRHRPRPRAVAGQPGNRAGIDCAGTKQRSDAVRNQCSGRGSRGTYASGSHDRWRTRCGAGDRARKPERRGREDHDHTQPRRCPGRAR